MISLGYRARTIWKKEKKSGGSEIESILSPPGWLSVTQLHVVCYFLRDVLGYIAGVRRFISVGYDFINWYNSEVLSTGPDM